MLAILCVSLLAAEATYAQVDIQYISPQTVERGQPLELRFDVPSVDESSVLEALLFFRTDGSGSFIQEEMDFINGTSEISLSLPDHSINSIEYYFLLRLLNGRQYTFPNITEDQPPLFTEVIEPRLPEFPRTSAADVAILSPDPGATLSQDDLFISAALFYDELDFNQDSFLIYLNGEDITALTETSPYLFKYYPQTLPRGQHVIQVLVRMDDTLHEVEQWTFNVAGNAVLGRDLRLTQSRREIGGNVEVGGRSQVISGSSTDALQGRIQLRGREGDFYYSLRSYVTTQESDRFQPVNRYAVNLRFRDNLFLNSGDVSPRFSSYSINGRRVRGINSGVQFGDRAFEIEAVYGTVNRSVQNLYDAIVVQESGSGNAIEEQFFLELEDGGAGAYERRIVGGRLSIGNPERFRFSLNALRLRDDTTSIRRIQNFEDVLISDPSLTTGLSQQQTNFLLQNPNQLQISSGVPRPQENLVLSTEVQFSADEQRVRFHTEFAASLLNQDISQGVLDREAADRLGIDLSDSQESFFNNLAWLIIINDQMSTLPFRYRDTESENSSVSLFFPSSIIASDTKLDLNYLNQRAQIQYRWVGPDYNSLANNTVRRDVAGFTFTDRFRFAQNRLMVMLGAERNRDNVNNYKRNTTINKGVRGNVGWYPFNNKLPRLNVVIRYRTRNNGVERFNPFINDDLSGASVRNFEIADGDTLITSTPRSDVITTFSGSITQSFNLIDANHQGGLSFSKTKTESAVFDYGDAESQNLSLSLRSQYNGRPFRTNLTYNNTASTSLSGLNSVKIHSINTGLDWAFLDQKLILNSMVSFLRSRFVNTPLVREEGVDLQSSRDDFFIPDFENINRRLSNSYILRFGAEYLISNRGVINFLFNYSIIDNRSNIFGNFPNDRIMQLSYAYRF